MLPRPEQPWDSPVPPDPTAPDGSGILGRRPSGMKLTVTLERDETGMVVAECPSIPGCISQGKTEEEALARIREAVVACLEVRAEQGLPLTVRTVEIDVSVA